jgi:hypothetical protein
MQIKRQKRRRRIPRAEAQVSCKWLRCVPVGRTFTIWNLQGYMRSVSGGIPCEQTCTELLQRPRNVGGYGKWNPRRLYRWKTAIHYG